MHIKKNIINQLQEDKGQFVLDSEVNARRGNAYYRVKLMHCFVFFLIPLVFLFDAFPQPLSGVTIALNNLGLARFVRSDHLLL